jgi:sporulation protein YlmC with PRC-barrel domain
MLSKLARGLRKSLFSIIDEEDFMKTTLRSTALALCMSMAFGSAFAAGMSDKVAPDLSRARKLIGTDVIDTQGKKIGDVKDVVLDKTRDQVAYAVVSFGGTLGLGTKYFAIPWKSLQPNPDNDKLVLNVDREKLKNAPGFDKDHWPDMASAQWNNDTYRYYNQRPYWESATAERRHHMSSGGSKASGTGKTSEGERSSGASDNRTDTGKTK